MWNVGSVNSTQQNLQILLSDVSGPLQLSEGNPLLQPESLVWLRNAPTLSNANFPEDILLNQKGTLAPVHLYNTPPPMPSPLN